MLGNSERPKSSIRVPSPPKKKPQKRREHILSATDVNAWRLAGFAGDGTRDGAKDPLADWLSKARAFIKKANDLAFVTPPSLESIDELEGNHPEVRSTTSNPENVDRHTHTGVEETHTHTGVGETHTYTGVVETHRNAGGKRHTHMREHTNVEGHTNAEEPSGAEGNNGGQPETHTEHTAHTQQTAHIEQGGASWGRRLRTAMSDRLHHRHPKEAVKETARDTGKETAEETRTATGGGDERPTDEVPESPATTPQDIETARTGRETGGGDMETATEVLASERLSKEQPARENSSEGETGRRDGGPETGQGDMETGQGDTDTALTARSRVFSEWKSASGSSRKFALVPLSGDGRGESGRGEVPVSRSLEMETARATWGAVGVPTLTKAQSTLAPVDLGQSPVVKPGSIPTPAGNLSRSAGHLLMSLDSATGD